MLQVIDFFRSWLSSWPLWVFILAAAADWCAGSLIAWQRHEWKVSEATKGLPRIVQGTAALFAAHALAKFGATEHGAAALEYLKDSGSFAGITAIQGWGMAPTVGSLLDNLRALGLLPPNGKVAKSIAPIAGKEAQPSVLALPGEAS